MVGEVFYRKGNLVHVNFGRKTKEHILEYIENAKERVDPKTVLTDDELSKFYEILDDIDISINDSDWNFLLSLIVNSRKDNAD
jgi:hypothetical protein